MKRFPNKSLFFLAALFLFHPAAVAQTIHLRDSLESVIVTATRTNSDHYVKPGLTKLGETDFSRGAALLGTPDIIKTLHTLPGTASGAEIFSGLFVRGGDGSDNLYLLDGVPLYQVSHLGGLFSSFNTDAVSGLNFYTGGFPAKYGGRLSSVVDVTTKEGDYEHYHGVFSMGLIDGRVRIEGPIVKNKISFAVSARRTWLDLIAAPAMKLYNKKNKKDLSEDYQFSDINARIDFRLSDKDKLSFHYYTGGDKLLYDEKRNASNHQKAFESTSETEMAFKWGNSLYSASYRHNTDDGLLLKITGYCSDNRSDMAYDYYVKAVSDGIESLEIINEGNFGRVADFGATAQASYYTGSGHDLNAGATLVWHKYNPSRTFVKSNGGEEQKQSFALPYDGSEWAVYASDAFQLGGFVMADLGLRYSGYSADGTDYSALEPRMTLSADLSRNISLTLAYSKMAQYSHLVAASFLDLPTNLWMPSTAEVGPMMSDLYSAGICYRPGSSWFMDIQGYYKHMSNLLYYDGVDSVFPPIERWNDSFSRGTGRAYGAECQMEYRSESISAALYYTLSWSQRKFDDVYDGWFPDYCDNRHKLTASVVWKPKKNVEIVSMWTIHSGNRVTAPSYIYLTGGEYYDMESGKTYPNVELIYTSPNNAHMPAYHRLDIGANFHKQTPRGNQAVWSVSVYNAYCHMNAIVMIPEQHGDGRIMGRVSGLIPIIPSVSYTLKF